MKKVSIENGNYLNVKVDGNKDLPAIIFSNSLGTDIRMYHLINPDPRCIFSKHMSPTNNIKIAYFLLAQY